MKDHGCKAVGIYNFVLSILIDGKKEILPLTLRKERGGMQYLMDGHSLLSRSHLIFIVCGIGRSCFLNKSTGCDTKINIKGCDTR